MTQRKSKLAGAGAARQAGMSTNPKVSKLVVLLAEASLMSAVLAALFEAAKQAMFPHITLWASHGMTVAAFSLLSTVACYFWLRARSEALIRTEADAERSILEIAAEQAGQAIVITDVHGKSGM